MNPAPRLNRLFATDGKCFDVAIDHGLFNEASFLAGVERIHDAVRVLIDANPDAIQLTVGQAPVLQSIPGKTKPSLVMRTDVANVYGDVLPRVLFSHLVDMAVEHALRLDAACIVVNLFLIPRQPEIHRECIQNVTRLKSATDRYGMPLMIEPLVMQANDIAGGYMVDGDPEKIIPLVRQAVELGADVIKADPTERVSDYSRVIEVAGSVPVLVRGGGKTSEKEILSRTYELMQTGARGIVYGRNVIQHEHPRAITEAFMAIVHGGATPDQALDIVRAVRTAGCIASA